MLKKFFMNTLSSFMGAWLALVLFGVVVVIVAIGMLAHFGASSSSAPSVTSHSVLKLELSGVIEETASPLDLKINDLLMGGEIKRPNALDALVKGLEEGASNKNIDALYIECKGVNAGLATLDALRDAVLNFKKSGKKVYAYGDSYAMGDYYVASVADSVFLNHGGLVELQGITGSVMYLKDLFDKLGISFQVAKVGTFKSAVEPMIMNEMSAPARAQLDTLYGNMWKYLSGKMADSRKKLTPEKLNSLINAGITFAKSEDFVSNGLVDRLLYTRQIRPILAAAVGRDVEKLNLVDINTLVDQTNWGMAYNSKKRVAVLYACGEISDHSGSGIDFERLVPVITELADDDQVSAMVLRVNSPGGSVFGSQEIGEALDYFMSKKKPLAVSMGDYAASGGYWISCCADRIFADPLTVTGSIGIFGLFPNLEGSMQKLGVSPQFVSTNPSAAYPNLFKQMDESQLAVLQKNVERGYDLFVGRVAKGRKMSEQKVRLIAEGRVWDAATAQRIGLVDQLGSLRDATDWVASKAGLKADYDVAVYPQFQPTFWDFLPSDSQLALLAKLQRGGAGHTDLRTLMEVSGILSREPIQARMVDMSVGFQPKLF